MLSLYTFLTVITLLRFALPQQALFRFQEFSVYASLFCCSFNSLPCCFRVFNKVKSRSAHMKSHRPLDAEPKRAKLEKPYEKVERYDERTHATTESQSKPAQ